MSRVVLHAEDESSWQFFVELLLESEGIEVISFANLGEAKEAFASQHFDAVICDGTINAINDGLKWAVELHETGHSVIILTAGLISSKLSSRIPYINKIDWVDGGDKRLLQLIAEASH